MLGLGGKLAISNYLDWPGLPNSVHPGGFESPHFPGPRPMISSHCQGPFKEIEFRA